MSFCLFEETSLKTHEVIADLGFWNIWMHMHCGSHLYDCNQVSGRKTRKKERGKNKARCEV